MSLILLPLSYLQKETGPRITAQDRLLIYIEGSILTA